MNPIKLNSAEATHHSLHRWPNNRLIVLWSFACSIFLVHPVWAAGTKRVIFVADDKTMSWGEGYYRQNPMPKDQFVREADAQNFADAWNKLAAGDKLIVLAHGTKGGGGITLGGIRRDGFKRDNEMGGGTGAGCGTAYALPKHALDNIMIDVKSCYGDADPDGEKPATSVAESLRRMNNGAGFMVTGSSVAVEMGFRVSYKPNPPPLAQKAATLNCLFAAATAAGFNGPGRIKAWFQSMPYPTQQSTINSVLQACRDNGENIVDGYNFTYLEPVPGTASNAAIADVASGTDDGVVTGGPIEEPDVMTETPCDPTCPLVAGKCALFGSPEGASCLQDTALSECTQLGGIWNEDVCVPAISTWGACVLTLMVLSSATVIIMRRQSAHM